MFAEGGLRSQHEHGSAVFERRPGQQLRPAARPAQGEGRGGPIPLRQLHEQGVQRRHDGTRGEQVNTSLAFDLLQSDLSTILSVVAQVRLHFCST